MTYFQYTLTFLPCASNHRCLFVPRGYATTPRAVSACLCSLHEIDCRNTPNLSGGLATTLLGHKSRPHEPGNACVFCKYKCIHLWCSQWLPGSKRGTSLIYLLPKSDLKM